MESFNQGSNTAYNYTQSQNIKSNNFATASLVMGIISIVCSCCCIGIPFSALGIIFAYISKTNETMEKSAKTGLITSVIGIVLSIAMLLVITVVVVISRNAY